jgi:hypothetical protein
MLAYYFFTATLALKQKSARAQFVGSMLITLSTLLDVVNYQIIISFFYVNLLLTCLHQSELDDRKISRLEKNKSKHNWRENWAAHQLFVSQVDVTELTDGISISRQRMSPRSYDRNACETNVNDNTKYLRFISF